MKKFIFIWLIIGIWSRGMAQDKRAVDSLNHIINDNSNSPESRVLSCVRQGQFYINKPGEDPRNIDSASTYLKQGKQLIKVFNIRTADGELLFLAALISKEKGLRNDASRLDSLALTFLRKKPGNYFLGEALLEKGDYLNTDDDKQLSEKIALLKEAEPCFAGVKYVRIRAGLWKSLGDLYGLRQEDHLQRESLKSKDLRLFCFIFGSRRLQVQPSEVYKLRTARLLIPPSIICANNYWHAQFFR